ncbi:hypothetical protein M409DRAFT_36906 [Zasmidium cellare ATCC 36951]|uniref:Carboxylic ester hydrolase n=1 Tax=Zasmidium cellare ATCC 36951 TaxID=1080233 RepID=A0A6A6CIS3_ZASCE|nr:uncharacterized protein M409DRAFT_36906 [Zasmidium cellare ATCC 36951]KAF2165306.1 hypothetical protein M409DRAFT_36906 [Zasmidium cellare ATCC 36951]
MLTHTPVQPAPHNDLVVTISSGTYAGLIDGTTPDVRQWRRLPFGLPPVGERRWLPPEPVEPNNDTRIQDATKYPPSCPQYLTAAPSIWNFLVPQFTIATVGQNKTARAYANSASEDCLYLAVWAPRRQRERLPVIMFITGGAFVNGGVDVPYQIPAQWVQRTRSHIVVTINYRLGIMGFPGTPALDQVNVGLWDQRAALEWVRESIAAFGGDPEKITLWGQSAGAISAEFQSFIEYDDPIARGYVMTSGSFGSGFTSANRTGLSFSAVAAHFGCRNSTAPASELACMRQVPAERLVTVASTLPGISFHPVQDNKTVFTDYVARYKSGQFAHKPAIYSTNTNDATGDLPFPPNPASVNTTIERIITDKVYNCPAATSSRLRSAFNPHVYRYQNAANFSNVSPVPWLGAYHFSDLAYIFGTDPDFRGASGAYENEVSRGLQDLVGAFVRDPEGVPGWPVFGEGRMVRTGRVGGPAVEVVEEGVVDAGCSVD